MWSQANFEGLNEENPRSRSLACILLFCMVDALVELHALLEKRCFLSAYGQVQQIPSLYPNTVLPVIEWLASCHKALHKKKLIIEKRKSVRPQLRGLCAIKVHKYIRILIVEDVY